MSEFEGTVSVVTGGASGIGLATALALQSAGSSVAVLDRETRGLPSGIAGFEVDVTDRQSIDGAIHQIGERHGRIDILVNNAGIGAVGTVDVVDEDEWQRVLNVNVVGMARVTSSALPWLRRSTSAAVVNLCSIAALNGLPKRALYSASKGAVLALTWAMATDHVHEGIRVNCVCPGTVSTPWVDRVLAEYDDPVAERQALDARQATGRMVTAEEVAAAILYLASPLSRSTTGAALEVDGGAHNLRARLG